MSISFEQDDDHYRNYQQFDDMEIENILESRKQHYPLEEEKEEEEDALLT